MVESSPTKGGAWDDGTLPVAPKDFARRVEGRDLLISYPRIQCRSAGRHRPLSLWSERCKLPDSYLFVGVLWPGDSKFLPVVDCIYEGEEAIASSKLLSSYLNQNAARAQSISFFSHSLGARTVLETVRGLDANPKRVILMAGAIENNCLVNEYADSASKVSKIYVVASRSDLVLEWAFPAGNLIGEIIMHGHPYDRTALGRNGPDRPIPPTINVHAWQNPDAWNYGHSDYLPKDVAGPCFSPPVAEPGSYTAMPVNEANPVNAEWKPGWSAGVSATQIDT